MSLGVSQSPSCTANTHPGKAPARLGLQQPLCTSESPNPTQCLSFPTCSTQRSCVTEPHKTGMREYLEQGVPRLILVDQTHAASTGGEGDFLLSSSALDVAERGSRTEAADQQGRGMAAQPAALTLPALFHGDTHCLQRELPAHSFTLIPVQCWSGMRAAVCSQPPAWCCVPTLGNASLCHTGGICPKMEWKLQPQPPHGVGSSEVSIRRALSTG